MSVNTTRQSDIIPDERLAFSKAVVVGCGAIGRQLSLQLASLGVPDVTLIDFDQVDDTNVCTQGYSLSDIGQEKVWVTAFDISKIAGDIQVKAIPEKFHVKHLPKSPYVVFMCVDSLQVRRFIWETVEHKAEAVIDGRMLGESMRVLAWSNTDMWDFAETIGDPRDVLPGRCTAKGTIYCAAVCAGLMVAQFAKWLRRQPMDHDINLGLFSMDLIHN